MHIVFGQQELLETRFAASEVASSIRFKEVLKFSRYSKFSNIRTAVFQWPERR